MLQSQFLNLSQRNIVSIRFPKKIINKILLSVFYRTKARFLNKNIVEQSLEFSIDPNSIMSFYALISSSLLLGVIVIVANFTVQFNISNTPLTFGALTYPFSFLLLDILSEKYNKKDMIKVVGLGILVAFYPSYLSATPQIALASIAAFCCSQPIDVALFYFFKRIFPKLWWLRNGAATIMAQFIDTLIFFSIAFVGVKTMQESMQMAFADYSIKAMIGLANTPIFYLCAIRAKRLWQHIS